MLKGDIVLIPFPFTDLTGSKLRPAVVLHNNNLNDIVIAFISSQISLLEDSDILIIPNATNGIKLKSVLKTNKIATVKKSLAKGILGTLSPVEINLLNENLIKIFQLV